MSSASKVVSLASRSTNNSDRNKILSTFDQTSAVAMSAKHLPEKEGYYHTIKVFLRLRSMNKLEASRRSRNCIHVHDDQSEKRDHPETLPRNVTVDSPLDGDLFDYTFDGVVDESTGGGKRQLSQLYQESAFPILQDVIKGYNGCIATYGQSGTGKSFVLGSSIDENSTTTYEDQPGIIPRLFNDLFDQLKHTANQWEYTIRCSYIELYMEKLFDLLVINPSTINQHLPLRVVDNSNRIYIQNALEVCCIQPSDMFYLLKRGNACRKVVTSSAPTDLSSDKINHCRSQTFFIINLEQRNTITHQTRISTLSLVDFAGSEYGSTAPTVKKYGGDGIVEAKLIHRGFYAITGILRLLASSSPTPPTQDQYQYSKLTQLLRHAIGGNCKTSVILTATSSECSIQETLNTLRFGDQLCHVINKNVRINEYQPIDWYARQCTQDKASLMLSDKKDSNFNCGAPGDSESLENIVSKSPENEVNIICDLKRQLSIALEQRDQAEGKFVELQSEVAILRSYNRRSKKEQEKLQNEVAEKQKESQNLSQKTAELEHELRTSTFRERQSTVFLRQFRKFYRRLLKHKAALGSGEVSDIVEKLPGVPDLKDLIDVDTLLYEAGLIEETEKDDDNSVATFRPSQKSLSMSFKAARKLARKGNLSQRNESDKSLPVTIIEEDFEADVNDDDAEDCSTETSSAASSAARSCKSHSLAAINGWSNLREEELLSLVEKYKALQIALSEEKIRIAAILEASGQPAGLKKLQLEVMNLKRDLNKKSHDLQAVIWKMNELHLINKTYSEKMSNREQHVSYLEETLQELQRQNRNLLLDKHGFEDKFREESKTLQNLADALKFPLWQFDEEPQPTLANRIILPIPLNKSNDKLLEQLSHDDTSQGQKEDSMSDIDPFRAFTSIAIQTDEAWPIALSDLEAPNMTEMMEVSMTKPSTKIFCDASIQTADMLIMESVAVQTDQIMEMPDNCISVPIDLINTAVQTESTMSWFSQNVAVQTDRLLQSDNTNNASVQTDCYWQELEQHAVVRTQRALPNSSGLEVALTSEQAPKIHVGRNRESPISVGVIIPTPASETKRVERSSTISSPKGFTPPPEVAIIDANDDVSHITSHQFIDRNFSGGKPSSFVPMRFAPKLGLAIKPGLKKDERGESIFRNT